MKSKKETITKAEIKKDIINSLKQPQKISKNSHKKWTIPCIVIALLLVVIEFIYPIIVLYASILLILLGLMFAAINHFKRQHKIKSVHTDDYDVITEVLSDTSQEEYVDWGYKRPSERVNNYMLRFKNGESWHVPQVNYPWSKERQMSDFAIYQSSNRGDVFIVVVKKDTGKIAMAYNTAFFEYKN